MHLRPQVEKPDYDLETAMGLYGLTDFELMWERAMDTKCLMAWNSKTHVGILAFRGTASMANVLADLQVCTLSLTQSCQYGVRLCCPNWLLIVRRPRFRFLAI